MALDRIVYQVSQLIRRSRFLRSLNLRQNVPFADLFIRRVPSIERRLYRLFRRNPLLGIVDGQRLYLDINDDEALMLLNRPYERRETATFRALCALVDGRAIIDVGANYGYYSVVGAAAAPHSRILAFEPDPRLGELLRKTSRLHNNRIEVFVKALGDKSGPGTLFRNDRWSGDNRVTPDLFHERPTEPIDIASLDDFVAAYPGGFDVGLIKADIQGGEPAMLAGARSLVERCRPYILLEFSPTHLEQAGVPAGMFLQELQQRFAILDVATGSIVRHPTLAQSAQWCERVRFLWETKGDGYTNLVLHASGEGFAELQRILSAMPRTQH